MVSMPAQMLLYSYVLHCTSSREQANLQCGRARSGAANRAIHRGGDRSGSARQLLGECTAVQHTSVSCHAEAQIRRVAGRATAQKDCRRSLCERHRQKPQGNLPAN